MKLPDVFKKKLQRKIFRKNKHNSVPIRTYRFKPKFQNNWLTARLSSVGPYWFSRAYPHRDLAMKIPIISGYMKL